MKKLNILIIIIFSSLLVGCGTTPEFNKRKYTKGKFRTHNKLKNYKGSSLSNEDEKYPFINQSKAPIKTMQMTDTLVYPLQTQRDINVPDKNQVIDQRKVGEDENLPLSILEKCNQVSKPSHPENTVKEVEIDFKDEIKNEEVNTTKNTSERRANISLVLVALSLLSTFNFAIAFFGLIAGLIGFVLAIYAITDKDVTKKARNRAIISVVGFLIFSLIATWFSIRLFYESPISMF